LRTGTHHHPDRQAGGRSGQTPATSEVMRMRQ
jgi:hypothetical protein